MVDRPELTAPEIADRYERSLHTVTKSWPQHPEWPGSVGKRGRYKTYDAQAVEDFVRTYVARPATEWEPGRLYTAREIAEGAGVSEGTIRADRSRGRWPDPDPDASADGTNRWTGRVVAEALRNRQGYHRSADSE